MNQVVLDVGGGTAVLVRDGEFLQHQVAIDPTDRPLYDLLAGWLTGPAGRVVVLSRDGRPVEQELIHYAMASLGTVTHVPRLPAIAAAVAGLGGREGVHLVCDAGDVALVLGLVEVLDGRVRVVQMEEHPDLGRLTFADALPSTVNGSEVLASRRLGPALRAARGQAAFRDTEIVPGVEAGLLLDCFQPFEERLRARVGSLLVEELAETVLTGAFSSFPLLPEALGVADPLTIGPEAVARGALFLAEGRFSLDEPEPVLVTLPLYRIHDGALEESLVPLPYGPGAFASFEGRPLLLSQGTSARDGAVPLPAALDLEVRGAARQVGVMGLPPGDYQVGLRISAQGATALLFSAEPTDPIVIPLEVPA